MSEFFEKEFNYDEVLKLPQTQGKGLEGDGVVVDVGEVEITDPDALKNP